MPRWLRIALTGWCFFLFFAGSPVIPLLVFPWIRLTTPDLERRRARATTFLHRATRFFTRMMVFYRLIDVPRTVELPPSVDPSQPYVLISNHPSLIDVVLTLGWFRGLTCLVKGTWKRSFALGPLIRATHHLFGPTGDDEEDVRGAIVAHLRRGHPVLVYPEGTRSLADRLHRFRRGAVEAAFEAGVPIVPMYLDVTQPFLMKGVPFWKAPPSSPRYRVEFFDVIDPRLESRTPREVNRDLQERYRARFARTVAERTCAADAAAHRAA